MKPETDDRPPLQMSDAQMKANYPALGPKMEMVALGEATYVRHLKEWVLLDAERHGHQIGDGDGPA